MPGATSFRQTEEKQSSYVIDLMLWSPKMDLVAVTAVTGEVLAFIRSMFWSSVTPNDVLTQFTRVNDVVTDCSCST